MKMNRRKPRSCRFLSVEQLEQRTVLTAPSITSAAAVNVAENQVTVMTVTATDPEAPPETLTYSISGGADAALFSINPTTGALVFLSARDFENPADAGTNNVYDVAVTVNDGNQGTATQSIAVTITGLNDNAPVFTSPTAYNVPENTTAVGTVAATDADLPAQTIAYSISGGADAARFSINSSTGVLSFQSAPNFEAPLDAGANNVYDIIVTANDGNGSTTTQNIAVAVTPVGDFAPVITSPAAFTVTENNATVGTVVATDADLPANTLTYSISGGADANLFAINPTTGALTFVAAPNFESPLDAGANNVYNLTVTVSDGTGSTANQNVTVTVTNIPIVFSSSAAFNVPENTTTVGTVAAADPDVVNQTITYSITGGADSAKFSINPATGALVFLAAPDFEIPNDAGTDRVYNLQVTANNGSGLTGVQNIAVSLTSVNDNAPVFTSPTAYTVKENVTAVGTANATDADIPSNSITYSITGGVDSARFNINPTTGAITFVTAPDFESPTDSGNDNVYDLQITANDGNGSTTNQVVTVTVQNATPTFTSSATFNVNENATAVGNVVATGSETPPLAVTYTITGGNDSSLFSIDAATGALVFLAAPDFENPLDAGTNNVYNVQITATDTSGAATVQNVTVNVLNILPVFTSPATYNVPENTTAVGTVVATNADVPAQAVTYSITGGADAAKFTIDPSTGVLAFVAAPDFEVPNDAGTDRIYNVQITASAGANSNTVQNVAVTVTAQNENAPVFTSPATFTVPENTAAVGTAAATDADLPAQALAYSISGGVDAARFSINPTTGVLTFVAAPDFETPLDDGVDNVYNIAITAADGQGMSTVQNVTVTVTALNDNAPVFTSAATFSVIENDTAVGNMTATDADLPPQTLSYSIVGGADEDLFEIDSITGVLIFVDAPDFETPDDANEDNVYNVKVRASDNGGSNTDRDITVTVTNEVDAPVITVNPQVATYYLHKDRAFVSPTATFVADSTVTSFAGSKLVVSITNNRNFRDTLSIYPKGSRAGQIDVRGHRVLYGGTVIGRVRGGKWFNPDLEIKFNAAATTAAINQLVKRVNFTADARRSIGDTRTVEFQLLDATGQITAEASRDINVLPPV